MGRVTIAYLLLGLLALALAALVAWNAYFSRTKLIERRRTREKVLWKDRGNGGGR
jgi:hypothetical protein